jgi:hypothetical protein
VNLFEYLIAEVSTTSIRELGEIQAGAMEGKISHGESRALMTSYNSLFSLAYVGIKAVAVFRPGVPGKIETKIRLTIERVRQAIRAYRAKEIDVKALRSVCRECADEEVEIRKVLRAALKK